MLDRLRSRIGPDLAVGLVRGEATQTTLADASVDLAPVANVWHELDDHLAALTELARILVPGGRAAILDWRPDVEQPPGPPLEHRIAASEVRSTLRGRGWNVETPQSVESFSYLLLATRP